MLRQLKLSNLIVLNKSNLATPEQLNEISAAVRENNPEATIVQSDYCDFDLSKLLEFEYFSPKILLGEEGKELFVSVFGGIMSLIWIMYEISSGFIFSSKEV